MQALARLRAFVRRREEDVGTAGTGGDYHAFAQSELHLARSKVCHKDDKTPDELLGLRIRRFNPRENLTRFRSAKRNLEFQQFLLLVFCIFIFPLEQKLI